MEKTPTHKLRWIIRAHIRITDPSIRYIIQALDKQARYTKSLSQKFSGIAVAAEIYEWEIRMVMRKLIPTKKQAW
jgi:hypothetical protein